MVMLGKTERRILADLAKDAVKKKGRPQAPSRRRVFL
jgi:hypothetical protein